MSEKNVQLNKEVIKCQLKELVRGSAKETLKEILETEYSLSSFLTSVFTHIKSTYLLQYRHWSVYD